MGDVGCGGRRLNLKDCLPFMMDLARVSVFSRLRIARSSGYTRRGETTLERQVSKFATIASLFGENLRI